MRKSVEPKKKTDVQRDVYIIKEEKPKTVDDFLPKSSYSYEGIATDPEAEEMIHILTEFIRQNEELVLDTYTSHDLEAVTEGFKRAIMIVELYFKSLYLGEEHE